MAGRTHQLASAAAIAPERAAEVAATARSYRPHHVGLVVLAVDDPARARAWRGLDRLLDHLFREGISALAVSPAPRADLVAWLHRLALHQRLPMRIAAEDQPATIPLGAAILLACSRLAMPPRHTLVVADGPHGAAGGAVAGCAVVAIGSASEQAALRRTGAAHGVTDLAELVPVGLWNFIDGAQLPG